MLTNVQLRQRVWGLDKSGGSEPLPKIVRRLRLKLGDDASNPTLHFDEPRVGYGMPKGGGQRRWGCEREEGGRNDHTTRHRPGPR